MKTSSQLYKRKARVIFVILTYKYGFKYLPQFPSSSGGFLSIIIMYSDSGTFCSIQFQPFWLPQPPVISEQARSSNKT